MPHGSQTRAPPNTCILLSSPAAMAGHDPRLSNRDRAPKGQAACPARCPVRDQHSAPCWTNPFILIGIVFVSTWAILAKPPLGTISRSAICHGKTDSPNDFLEERFGFHEVLRREDLERGHNRRTGRRLMFGVTARVSVHAAGQRQRAAGICRRAVIRQIIGQPSLIYGHGVELYPVR
jgi:hypothetical protein